MKFKLFLPLLLLSATLQAQSLTWVKGMSGSSSEYAQSMTKDSYGNYYLTGQFQGTVDFDPGSGTTSLTSAGNNDIFVAKYNSSGSLVWAFKIGGTGGEAGYGITIDNSNNILVTGTHGTSNIDFDPGSGTATLPYGGSSDIFLAKYDENGNYVWAFGLGDSGAEEAQSITYDSENNVYIGGIYQSSNLDMDPGSGSTTISNSGSAYKAFVAKYDSSGNFAWAFGLGNGTNAMQTRCVRTDKSNNIIVTGLLGGSSISMGSSSLSASGGGDVFLAKYTSNGNEVWAVNFGGSVGQADNGSSVAIDNSNNIYVSGSLSGSNVDLDPGSGTTTVTCNSLVDLFLAKFDSSGNFAWGFNVGGTQNNENGYCLYTDNNNIYMGGVFNSYNVDFDPGSGTYYLGTTNVNDGFIAKYSSAGALNWAFKVGGTSSDYCFAITQGTSTGIAVCGYFSNSNCNFNPDTTSTSTLTNSGSFDIFFALFDGTLVPVQWMDAKAKRIADTEVKINWACASEMNNDFFTVERSTDAQAWTEVQQVPGSGTTLQPTYYSITDQNAPSGNLYYRIKQTDYNGKFSYSNMLLVDDMHADFFSIHPNPAHGTVTLTMQAEASGGTVYIRDLFGKTVLSMADYINSNIDIQSLPAGTYLLEYTSTRLTAVKKLVVY